MHGALARGIDDEDLPVALKLTEGQAHDGRTAAGLLSGLAPGQILLGDRAYDSDALEKPSRTKAPGQTSSRSLIASTFRPSAPSSTDIAT